jgi:hypothetical protein
MRIVSLSIIRCVTPATLKDVGARVGVYLEDEESLVCTVSQTFPFNNIIGFTVNMTETSPNLQQMSLNYFGSPGLMSEHMSAIDKIADSIGPQMLFLKSLGYASLEDFQGQLKEYKQRIRATEWIPAYIHGSHGHNIIAINDALTARTTTLAYADQLSIGRVCSLDTML